MSDHLRDVLTAFADEQGRASAASAPDPSQETRVLGRRIARRRAVRTGAMSLTAAAAVAGVAVGADAVVDREVPPPATTTPSPTPAPTPAPSVVLPPVTEHPLLPEAEPMPPGTFARTGPGWVLAQWSLETGDGRFDGVLERTYFYLQDPSGTRYEVPFDTERSVKLVDWLPGTATVVVQLGTPEDWSIGSDSWGVALMDLEAGTFHELPGVQGRPALAHDGTVLVATWDSLISYSAEGEELSRLRVRDEGTVVPMISFGLVQYELDPGRTRIAVRGAGGIQPDRRLLTTDLEPLDAPAAQAHLQRYACGGVTWLDESTLVTACGDGGRDDRLRYWKVPLAGTPAKLPVETSHRWEDLPATGVGADVYITEMPGVGEQMSAPSTTRIAPDGTTTRVEATLLQPTATGNLLIGYVPQAEPGHGELTALDTRTGATFVVLPGETAPTPGATHNTWTRVVPAR